MAWHPARRDREPRTRSRRRRIGASGNSGRNAAGARQRQIVGAAAHDGRSSGVALDAPGASKDQLGLVLIVAPAAQRDVLGGRRTSQRVGPDVMELQEGALGASASFLADEGALAPIAPPRRSFDVAPRMTPGGPGILDRAIPP